LKRRCNGPGLCRGRLSEIPKRSPQEQRPLPCYHEKKVFFKIEALYEQKPFGDEDYYAVFFEGPDRLKLEFVYAPNYCDPKVWPSNMEDDFDPYLED